MDKSTVTQGDREIEWLEAFGRSPLNCTRDENDIIQSVAAIARHRTEEVERLREALREIIEHFGSREQGPGHSHTVPGIWDDDNIPEIAGKPCEWCAKWKAAHALAGEP